jgi:hypothetical protein
MLFQKSGSAHTHGSQLFVARHTRRRHKKESARRHLLDFIQFTIIRRRESCNVRLFQCLMSAANAGSTMTSTTMTRGDTAQSWLLRCARLAIVNQSKVAEKVAGKITRERLEMGQPAVGLIVRKRKAATQFPVEHS